MNDRRITIREVADDVGISIGSWHEILSKILGMKRVAAKFVPKHSEKKFDWIKENDLLERLSLNNFFCAKRNANAFDRQSKRPGLDTQRSGRVPFFHRKNCSNIYWKFHLVLNDLNSNSQVDRVDMVEFGYYSEWYTLLIINIIDWNDLETFV